jgi:riboflavin biosynthesis pyrimidine reductase
MSRVTPLAPEPGDAVELDGAALDAWLAERYRLDAGPWLRLNMVTGIGGQIAGASGTSADLTGGIDGRLMRVLRREADVLLVGAGSVRAMPYPMPQRIPLAIATTTGDLTAVQLPEDTSSDRLLVLHPRSVSGRVAETAHGRVTPVPIDGGIVGTLRALGLGRVLCEGGGALASALIASGDVTEFAQTIAPVAHSPAPTLLTGPVPPARARLEGLLRDETDRLYLRWYLLPR